jgi:hypothetical protein
MNAINGAATTNVVTNPGTLSPNRLAFGEPATTSSGALPPASDSPTTTTPTSGSAGTSGASGPSSAPAPAIPAPSSIVALPGLQSARLTWTDSETDEFPHTAHIVRVYRAGKLFTQVTVGNNNTHQVLQLRAGSSHYFTVAAINAGGVSPFSLPSNVIIPVKKTGGYTATNRAGLTDESSVPAAPTSLRTSRSRSTAIVRWTPPTNMRATSYEVLFTRGGKVMTQVVTDYSGGIKIFGLKKGLYSVRVRALNEAGAGRLSAAKRVRL